MNSKNDNSTIFTDEVKWLIRNLRRKKNIVLNWQKFRNLIEHNPEFTCSVLNTRWLVSIADTYADYGNEIERRNALYISILANFEKLTASRLLIYDIQLNTSKLEKLKKNRIIPLWDGMYSFNINRGDMINNLFYRIRAMFIDTPVLLKIFETVLNRILSNNTTFSNLNIYHHRLLENPKKNSLIKAIIKKIRFFFENYRLY